MRRLIALTLLTTLFVSACKRRPDDAPPEVPADLLSAFEVNDPRAAVQLTRGFFELEGNAWRWAAPQFSAVLAVPPLPPSPQGAVATLQLQFKFTIPDVVFNSTGPLTLSASTPAGPLPSQTYNTPGEHVYTADFPAPSSLAVAIDFKSDKYVTPGGEDARNLAVIAQSVGLSAK